MSWLSGRLEALLSERANDPAIDAGAGDAVTYGRLREISGAIAGTLAANGPVAILANRSAEAYAAVLACFRAGVAYVPLNPAFPASRLRKVVELSGAAECLFDPRHSALASGLGCPARPVDLNIPDTGFLPPDVDDSRIAYRLFTSGSTGEPKGVPIPRRALSHYVQSIIACVGIENGLRASQFFDLSFDLAMHDIFVTLATGGTIVPARDLDLMMPHQYVGRNRIDVWFSVPALAVPAIRGQAARPIEQRLRKILFCGEALPWDYADGIRALLAPGGDVWNLYGPTEATIAFTAYHAQAIGRSGTVPLGSPFGENRVAILNENGVVEAAEGSEGELLLGGPQVFAGYDPATDRSPFVEGPRGIRYYRTGDLVRMADSDLAYLGRLDHQVKIRGHRVELGEIETACRTITGVDAAVAMLIGEGNAQSLIVAYQSSDDVEFGHLSSSLPDYMVPSAYHRFDELPKNANGKIDRRQIGQALCSSH